MTFVCDQDNSFHGIITQEIQEFFFSVSRIFFLYLMASIDSPNDQNTMRRVI